MLHEICTVSTTVSSIEQAKQLARMLVDSRLVACVQIDGPIESIYRWQGEVQDDCEFRLVCKTLPSMVGSLIDSLRSQHPYDVPELLVLRCECSAQYARWLADQVSSSKE
jgi:periplasmic divalent cation tolerance protein